MVGVTSTIKKHYYCLEYGCNIHRAYQSGIILICSNIKRLNCATCILFNTGS